jgi:glycosyltransferase involved in cell wall biosynthesis
MFRRNRRGREPRVLIIVQNLPVPLDRRVWLESQALRDAGYGVSVICPRGPEDSRFEELDGIRIHRYRPAPATHGIVSFVWEFAYCWFVTLWLAKKIFWREGFDVIQACNPPDTFWALALLFRPLGVRFVFDQHDLCPEVYDARFEKPNPVLARGLRLLERASYKTAHHVIVTNALYRGIALERGHLDPADVTVVRNGPIADRFVRGDADDSLRRGRKYLCCYLGIMGPQDGVELIVQVANAVRARGRDDVQFTLLGFGDELDNLKALAAALGVDDCVEFTGRADDDMVKAWLSTADLGIVPDPKTPFNDVSSMNKTVEYMAFGLPVVAFDLRETMATADAAGAFVPQPDAESFATVLLEVLDDPVRREKMARFGRDKFVRELAWHDQATKYVEVYDTIRDARQA